MTAGIYVAETRDFYGNRYAKVGYTSKIEKRIHTLKVGCPHPISHFRFFPMPDAESAHKAERATHKALARHRAHGEWFFAMDGDEMAGMALDIVPGKCVATITGHEAEEEIFVVTSKDARDLREVDSRLTIDEFDL